MSLLKSEEEIIKVLRMLKTPKIVYFSRYIRFEQENSDEDPQSILKNQHPG